MATQRRDPADILASRRTANRRPIPRRSRSVHPARQRLPPLSPYHKPSARARLSRGGHAALLARLPFSPTNTRARSPIQQPPCPEPRGMSACYTRCGFHPGSSHENVKGGGGATSPRTTQPSGLRQKKSPSGLEPLLQRRARRPRGRQLLPSRNWYLSQPPGVSRLRGRSPPNESDTLVQTRSIDGRARRRDIHTQKLHAKDFEHGTAPINVP